MENKTRWHKLLIEITGDFDNKRPLQNSPKINSHNPLTYHTLHYYHLIC